MNDLIEHTWYLHIPNMMVNLSDQHYTTTVFPHSCDLHKDMLIKPAMTLRSRIFFCGWKDSGGAYGTIQISSSKISRTYDKII